MVNFRRNTSQVLFGDMFWLDFDVDVVGDNILLAYFIVVFKDLNILWHIILVDLFGSQFFWVSRSQ